MLDHARFCLPSTLRLSRLHHLRSKFQQSVPVTVAVTVPVVQQSSVLNPWRLLLAVVCLSHTLLSFVMNCSASTPFNTLCTLVLLLTSASLIQRADAQEIVEKTCAEVYGNVTDWPTWVSECYNNGTCMLYYPYEDDPDPFPYCICEPPYTGMACEAIDWNADMTMMAGTYAGIISVVGFTLFGIVVLLICFCYRKKLRKHRAEKLGHKDGKQMESGRYDLKGLSDTFQIETKSTLQTPTTGTTTINGISDLDENANERSHLGNNGLSTVDEEGLIAKQARLLDNATPRFVPSRAASLRVSRLIRDSDTIKFIDEEEFDEVDGAGNPVSRSGNAVATSIV